MAKKKLTLYIRPLLFSFSATKTITGLHMDLNTFTNPNPTKANPKLMKLAFFFVYMLGIVWRLRLLAEDLMSYLDSYYCEPFCEGVWEHAVSIH